ncbi:MAG: radical SAM protein [Desulfobacteraceae bacterium]|nr:radical SAM protein [Desulfobacteraceae bacterium]
MNINKIQTKSVITKSNLPDADFVINPYIGCTHSCIYCYARFMKRFTGHQEKWGQFLDIKLNSSETIPKNSKKIKNKSVFISSVTDPYLHLEKKYKITRKILKKILPLEPNLSIQTKSSLIVRDIDILKEFANCRVGMTITTLNDAIRKQVEPNTAPIEQRLAALKKLKQSGISTYIFIGPILPFITDWKKIVENTKEIADSYMFENLNMHGTISHDIYTWIKRDHDHLLDKYASLSKNKAAFWNDMEIEINEFCTNQNIDFKLYFDHKKQRKR